LPEGKQDFSSIITRIRETIYNQKFTGAAAGFLNPNIIARDFGLTDKKEVATFDTFGGHTYQ
jgi:DNA-packaging protein gp3